MAARAAGVEEGQVEVGAGDAEGGVHRWVGEGVGPRGGAVVLLHQQRRRGVSPGGGAHDQGGVALSFGLRRDHLKTQ
jgi:hypothetical protein